MSKRECVQCAAQTKTGARCRKITCIYGEFCGVHTKALFDLAIKKGANIAKYTGKMVSDEEFEANPSSYGLVVKKKKNN